MFIATPKRCATRVVCCGSLCSTFTRGFRGTPVVKQSTKSLRPSGKSRFGNRKVIYAMGLTGGVGLWWLGVSKNDHVEDPLDIQALSRVPLGKLVTGWIAFAFCSSPAWVDMSETLYGVVSKIPIVSYVANRFTMVTFFNQFLGGETTQDCIPKIDNLRDNNIGTLLGYNIEAELDGSSKHPDLIRRQINHVLESISVQGQLAKKYRTCEGSDAERLDSRCWVRLKLTGLVSHPIALYNASQSILKSRAERGLDKDVPHPGLPHDGDWDAALKGEDVRPEDRQQLEQLHTVLEVMAEKAKGCGVRLVIDAEQTWYQPVIDSLTDQLMQKHNKLDRAHSPIIIASFQAYLRRYPQYLDQQLRRADEKGYALLFKQIRGAYMVTEAERWNSEDRKGPAPVWSTKAETDASFNGGIDRTLAVVAEQIRETGRSRISAVFATHNSLSVDHGIRALAKYGLAWREKDGDRFHVYREAAGSFCFAQLYGMKDDLTNKIVGSLAAPGDVPLVVKSMSYGDLKECLPFLARRATENKSVLEGRGGARAERLRLGAEIKRRLLPW